jgi:hypothetical protein
MEVDDRAARGREAALEVRRSKKQNRQAAVRKLEERGVPRMKMRAELKALGFTGSQGKPISQGTLWNDLQDLGYGQRRPRKYPKPEPRECKHPDCHVIFTPDASQLAKGDGRFHSPLCARRSPEGRKVGRTAATERHRVADEELERLNAAGLVNTRQAADELGVTESTLYDRYAEVLAPVEHRLVDGEQLRLVRERDVKALARERLVSPWVAYYKNPTNYLMHAAKLDVPLERARHLLERREEASKRHRLIRIGTGRPKGTGPPAYHYEWAEAFWELEAELREQYDLNHHPEDPPPAKWEVAILVALDDYIDHPERWKYAPEEQRRPAADRVWTAVKALQIAQSETRT